MPWSMQYGELGSSAVESAHPRRNWVGVVEALAFALAVIAYIWYFRFRWPPSVWLLLIAVGLSCRAHSETAFSTGLSLTAFWRARREWRFAWLGGAIALLLVAGEHLFIPELLYRGLAYSLWCGVQQFLYQNMVYKRFRDALGPPRAALVAGVVFALVHLPNPVLVPATLLWGAASSRLFERLPSIPALALLQWILSSVLYELSPYDWHHGFRVGPGYFWGRT